ncbi:hypothetical protein Syun_026815 [Stephania yunnanensis]|uniref:Uncharacterized protein n=1 Tax=Stephania yunnanensis TaxID=152371 RepID=A0AAP0HM47_9MAGN
MDSSYGIVKLKPMQAQKYGRFVVDEHNKKNVFNALNYFLNNSLCSLSICHMSSLCFVSLPDIFRRVIGIGDIKDQKLPGKDKIVKKMVLQIQDIIFNCSSIDHSSLVFQTQLFFNRSLTRVPEKDKSLENAAKGNTNIPSCLSLGAQNLIMRILDPNSATRITIAEIKEDCWFNQDYIPSTNHDNEELEDDFQIKDNVPEVPTSKLTMTTDSSYQNVRLSEGLRNALGEFAVGAYNSQCGGHLQYHGVEEAQLCVNESEPIIDTDFDYGIVKLKPNQANKYGRFVVDEHNKKDGKSLIYDSIDEASVKCQRCGTDDRYRFTVYVKQAGAREGVPYEAILKDKQPGSNSANFELLKASSLKCCSLEIFTKTPKKQKIEDLKAQEADLSKKRQHLTERVDDLESELTRGPPPSQISSLLRRWAEVYLLTHRVPHFDREEGVLISSPPGPSRSNSRRAVSVGGIVEEQLKFVIDDDERNILCLKSQSVSYSFRESHHI